MQNIENVRRGRDYVWQKWKNFKRQIRRILILEQAAKIGLLLPLPAQIPEGGFSIWSWILTAALTFLYLKIMLDFSKNCRSILPQTEKKEWRTKQQKTERMAQARRKSQS